LTERLHIKGRVRVARDGINCTLGGLLEDLQQHAAEVSAHPLLQGNRTIDFKYSALPSNPSQQLVLQSKFDRLVVRRTAELVTFLNGRLPAEVFPSATAPHLSPQQYHESLTSATQSGGNSILIDTRNIYESRIGSFEVPGIATLKPPTRIFSDFSKWADQHEDQLRGRQVFMFCTGGVRCERASAYIRAKGPDFQDVVQLEGGIVRYLEAFGEQGYFVGRNFVFDPRAAHGGPEHDDDSEVELHSTTSSTQCIKLPSTAHCAICGEPHGDYQNCTRCSACRMLVLVCEKCQSKPAPLCELCLHPADDASTESFKPLHIIYLKDCGEVVFSGRVAALQKRLSASNISILDFNVDELSNQCIQTVVDSFPDDDFAILLNGSAFLKFNSWWLQNPRFPSCFRFLWIVDCTTVPTNLPVLLCYCHDSGLSPQPSNVTLVEFNSGHALSISKRFLQQYHDFLRRHRTKI
jgi:predicted sulfurtransferase